MWIGFQRTYPSCRGSAPLFRWKGHPRSNDPWSIGLLALPATRSASSFQTSRSLAIPIRSRHRAPTIYRRFQEHETLSAKKGKWSVIVSASNSFVMRWLGSNSCYRIRLYTSPGIIHPNNRITMVIQWHVVVVFHLNCSPRISSKLLNTSTNVSNGNETLLTLYEY